LSSCGRQSRSTGSHQGKSVQKTGYTYFLTNKPRGTLYIGVTSNLVQRIYQHQNGLVQGFSKKYNLKKLVHYDVYEDIETAILYEKKLKNLHREKKIAIIEKQNPEWMDLSNSL
jgi:putative endonuclease